MKDNFTAVAVIMDASGSMSLLSDDTIGSFNTFLTEQKTNPAETVFSLCTFNTAYHLVHDFVPLHTVAELTRDTYRASGGTALLDAMGHTIDSLGNRLSAMPEHERPSKVIVMVITDGEENSSHRYTLDQIRAKVEHQRSVYSWEFIFVGANIDAMKAGTSLGIAAHNSVAYVASAGGTGQLYRSLSQNMNSYRTSKNSSQVDFFGQTGITPTSVPVPADPKAGQSTPAVTPFDPGHSFPTVK
jgi:uncharacterized protein YegL